LKGGTRHTGGRSTPDTAHGARHTAHGWTVRGAARLELIGALCLLLCLPRPAATAEPVRAPRAMVASVDTLASQAGIAVMKAGGNAVDAAVAVGFALAVTHPQAGNLGGGGFMLVRMRDGKASFLDFRETAPGAAWPDLYLDAARRVIPGASLVGYRAIAVPGSVAGLLEASNRWGRLSRAEVMVPAIRLADEGFAAPESLARALQSSSVLRQFPESRRIFLRDGSPYAAGETFRQPDLARTLRRIAAGGAEEFYRGALARELAAGIRKGGGLITEEDLKGYAAKLRQPLEGSYRGHRILAAPPPSSGGIALIHCLNILEGTGYAATGHGAPESLHWMAEAMRRAFADRAEFLGDPDFTSIPVRALLSKAYAAHRRATINPRAATPSSRIRHGNPLPFESSETTHYSVVDSEGNAVACTTTLNGNFGSGVTAEGLGFLLNNEMDDFTTAPGVPNTYGLIQGPANEIRPGKRPLSSMSPTIVTRDDGRSAASRLLLVLGSPGGPRIISSVLQALLNVVDFQMNVQEAVDAPRIHHQWLPDRLYLEGRGFSAATLAALRALGHETTVGGLWSDVQAIMIDPVTGERLGGSDGRYPARPLGY
jgi:gamma-glutamyltranspeptidase/glutathione hydrolase